MSDDKERVALHPKDRVEAYLKLYERQMAHYENTQGIEWKVNIGVWTLLAAATVWASDNTATTTTIPAWGWWVAVLLVVAGHWLWLWLMHRSEEEDKKFWCQCRTEAWKILGAASLPAWEGRPWWKEALWLISEVGVTAAMAIVLLSFS